MQQMQSKILCVVLRGRGRIRGKEETKKEKGKGKGRKKGIGKGREGEGKTEKRRGAEGRWKGKEGNTNLSVIDGLKELPFSRGIS